MDIFIADLNKIINNATLIKSYEKRLLPNDLVRYNQITHANRRLQFLVGRMLIYENLSGTFNVTQTGKLVSNGTFLSLAHSESMVILGMDNKEIGVDVEDKSKRRNFKSLANVCHLKDVKDDLSFYREFTKYEADYKLGVTAKDHQFYELENYLICLASEQKILDVVFFDVVPFIQSCVCQNVQRFQP